MRKLISLMFIFTFSVSTSSSVIACSSQQSKDNQKDTKKANKIANKLKSAKLSKLLVNSKNISLKAKDYKSEIMNEFNKIEDSTKEKYSFEFKDNLTANKNIYENPTNFAIKIKVNSSFSDIFNISLSFENNDAYKSDIIANTLAYDENGKTNLYFINIDGVKREAKDYTSQLEIQFKSKSSGDYGFQFITSEGTRKINSIDQDFTIELSINGKYYTPFKIIF